MLKQYLGQGYKSILMIQYNLAIIFVQQKIVDNKQQVK